MGSVYPDNTFTRVIGGIEWTIKEPKASAVRDIARVAKAMTTMTDVEQILDSLTPCLVRNTVNTTQEQIEDLLTIAQMNELLMAIMSDSRLSDDDKKKSE